MLPCLWIFFEWFSFWIYSPTGHMREWSWGGDEFTLDTWHWVSYSVKKSMIFVKPWNTIPYSTVISWDTCRFLTLLKYMWLLSLFLILLALLIEKEFKSWLHRCTEEREREIEMCCFPIIYEDLWHFSPKISMWQKSKNFRIPVVGKTHLNNEKRGPWLFRGIQ